MLTFDRGNGRAKTHRKAQGNRVTFMVFRRLFARVNVGGNESTTNSYCSDKSQDHGSSVHRTEAAMAILVVYTSAG